ncbi:MAG: ribosome biogenesis GTPase Der [Holosporaceae bacterium]|jgi:GTP-binding protein|nr:ribosome biogenesis GTPase Der [Holosporaceae bacterium]
MKIAIIGRPNVGKSTLFNRLVGQKSAIVGDVSGITRDRKSMKAELFGLEFDLLDTPGVDPFSKNSLAVSMNGQSLAAIEESDLIFFVVDATEGATEYDKAIASWIRSAFKKVGNRPVILLKNKSEGKTSLHHPETLGFGEEIAISAEHKLGMDEVFEAISSYSSSLRSNVGANHSPLLDPQAAAKEDDAPIRIAIVGRPNVGKSTLINAIIGEERLLVGDQAGITRDSISLNWKFKNRDISLIDTAGQRRKSKVDEKVEALSVVDAWKHVRQAHIVVILMDIQNPFEKQDMTIARKVFDEGKILIFGLNKSDAVENPDEVLKTIKRRAEKEFAQLPEVPCLLISAKEKKGLIRIFNVALDLYDNWSRRISTGALNKWFQAAISQNPPPLANGTPIKLKYISQTNCKPPTFALFANRVEKLPTSYERYLLNHLRKTFNFVGTPLRIFLRQRENPYDRQS